MTEANFRECRASFGEVEVGAERLRTEEDGLVGLIEFSDSERLRIAEDGLVGLKLSDSEFLRWSFLEGGLVGLIGPVGLRWSFLEDVGSSDVVWDGKVGVASLDFFREDAKEIGAELLFIEEGPLRHA